MNVYDSIDMLDAEMKKNALAIFKKYFKDRKAIFFDIENHKKELTFSISGKKKCLYSISFSEYSECGVYFTSIYKGTKITCSLGELSTDILMKLPSLFKFSLAKYIWERTDISNGKNTFNVDCFDNAEDAYQDMISNAFKLGREFAYKEDKNHNLVYNINIGFDNNTIFVRNYKFNIINVS